MQKQKQNWEQYDAAINDAFGLMCEYFYEEGVFEGMGDINLEDKVQRERYLDIANNLVREYIGEDLDWEDWVIWRRDCVGI